MGQLYTGHLRQEYSINGHSQLCVYIHSTDNFISREFRHKTAKQTLVIHDRKSPEWIEEAMQKKAPQTLGRDRFQRPGKPVFKRLPQQNEVKETCTHDMGCLHELPVFKANELMHMYVKHGSIVDAHHVFDNMPKRNAASWNIMILGYAKQEEGELALDLYARMHEEGIQPQARTFLGALKACGSLAALEEGKHVHGKFVRAIHSQIVKSGLEEDVYVGTTLVDIYAKCGSMEDTRSVFEDLPHRNVVSWNAMILGYSKQQGKLAFDLFARMQHEGVTPDHFTIVSTLKACSSMAALEEGNQIDGNFAKIGCLEKGRAIHFQVVKSGLESDPFVGNTLVDMYIKCGSMGDASAVFDVLSNCDVVSYNAMILGYSNLEEGALALDLYGQMQQEGVQPSPQTFVGTLKACSSLAAIHEGKQADHKFGCLQTGRAIHTQVVKSCFETNVFVGNTLVDMYAKCGSMEDAQRVFDYLPRHDVFSWTPMILGYAEQEGHEEALRMYEQMQEQVLSPDSLAFVAILKACRNTATLETGKRLHSQISKVGLATEAIVANSLIEMYTKCGSMIDAQRLFDALPRRDVVIWNSLIAGYARQGESEVVFCLFERMRQEGIQPDGNTFLSVLTVCSHVGLVDQGQKYLEAMSKQYDIIPNIEHYTCIIDLLGRAGHIDEVVTIVEKMPIEPDVVVWLTVLGACQKWQRVEVGRYAFQKAVRLDRRLSVAYILMANIYADAHMQEDCLMINLMRKNAEA